MSDRLSSRYKQMILSRCVDCLMLTCPCVVGLSAAGSSLLLLCLLTSQFCCLLMSLTQSMWLLCRSKLNSVSTAHGWGLTPAWASAKRVDHEEHPQSSSTLDLIKVSLSGSMSKASHHTPHLTRTTPHHTTPHHTTPHHTAPHRTTPHHTTPHHTTPHHIQTKCTIAGLCQSFAAWVQAQYHYTKSVTVFLPLGIDNMHGSRQAVGVNVMSNCAGCSFQPHERTCTPESGCCLPRSWLSPSA